MSDEKQNFLNRLVHDVSHSVKDVEHAAARRWQALWGIKPRDTNVNDKSAN